jgi:hypothetical protein
MLIHRLRPFLRIQNSVCHVAVLQSQGYYIKKTIILHTAYLHISKVILHFYNVIRDCNNTVLIEIQTQIILTVLIIWCCEMTHRNKKNSHNNVEF